MLNVIYAFLREFSKARTASSLARAGKYKEARAVLAGE